MTPDEQAFADRLTRLEERFAATQESLTQARRDMERRMVELNDVRTRFMPREVYERDHAAVSNRVTSLEKSRDAAVGQLIAYGSIIGFILALGTILVHFWK